MRDMYVIVLRQIWETIQAIVNDGDDFCPGCNGSCFEVRTDDIKHSGLREVRMTRYRTGDNQLGTEKRVKATYFGLKTLAM